MSVEAAFSPASVASFKAACAETVANTGKTMPQVILWASRFFCGSARKHTPKCTAPGLLRAIEDNPEYPMTSRQQLRIVTYSQAAGRYYVPTSDSDDKRRKILYAGAARNSWNGCALDLGRSGPSTQGGRGDNLGDATRQLSGDEPRVTLRNYVSYMPVIAPGILDATLARTAASLEHQLSREAVKQFKRNWKVA